MKRHQAQADKPGNRMNKTLAACAVLGVCMSNASAQSTVTIYGIIDAGLTRVINDSGNGNNGTRTTLEAGQMQTSRWGLRGEENLGDGLKARFGLEGLLANDTGAAGIPTGTPSTTSLFDREATVGLSGGFGALNLGRQNVLGMNAIAMADPMAMAFAPTNPNVLFSVMNSAPAYGAYGANNGGSALRQSNSIRYTSPYYKNVGIALMRAFGEQPGSTEKSRYEGVSAFYHTGPLSVAAVHARMKNVTAREELKSHAFGVRYTRKRITLRSTYAANRVDTTRRKISVFGVGVDVPVAPAVTLTGAVYNTRRSGDTNDDSQQYMAIAKYALSKRSTAYASIGYARTDDVVTATQINLAQGLVSVGSDSAQRFTTGMMHVF
jgi:predicted porin